MAHLVVLVFTLCQSVSQICAVPVHNPQSQSFTMHNAVTDTVSPILSMGQVVLLYDFEDPSSESAVLLGQRIIERSASLEIPLEICSNINDFRRQNYENTKLQVSKLVFLYIPPVGPSGRALYFEDLLMYNTFFRIHWFVDLVIYLTDASHMVLPSWSRLGNKACWFPEKTVAVEFRSLEPQFPVDPYGIRFRCADGKTHCELNLWSSSTTANRELRLAAIISKLKNQKADLEGHEVMVLALSQDPRHYVEAMTFRGKRIMKEMRYIPLFHLARDLNFSLDFRTKLSAFSQVCRKGLLRLNSIVNCGLLVPCHPVLYESAVQHSALQPYETVAYHFPLYFYSLLAPFHWTLWLSLMLVMLFVCILSGLKTQWKVTLEWILALIAYSCGQDYPVPQAAQSWCTFWILVTFFVGNVYTGILSSLRTVPQITVINTTVEELLERGTTFFATATTHRTHMNVYGPNRESHLSTMVPQSDLRKARYLATRLRPLEHNIPAKKLRENIRASAWLVAPTEVRATSEVFTEELGLSSHILPLPFLSFTTWSMFQAINVGGLTMQYRRLFDAGTVRYWAVAGDRQDEGAHKEQFLTAFGLKAEGERQYSKPLPWNGVMLSESVVVETLCLYGLCLAGSLTLVTVVALWQGRGNIKALWGKLRNNLHNSVVYAFKHSHRSMANAVRRIQAYCGR